MFYKKSTESKGKLTAEVETFEQYNSVTGDIDQKLEVEFFDDKTRKIGWARVVKKGKHGVKTVGDVSLAEYFGLTAEA